MKRLFVIIPVLFWMALPACKKASGPADGNSIQQNNNRDSTVAMNAMINGSSWQTDTVVAYYVKYSGNDSGVVSLQINGTQTIHDSSTSVTLYITNYTGPNTYTINPPLTTATYYSNGNLRNFADSGQIVILSDTAYALKGTFVFTADTFRITSGVFNAALP